MEEEEKDDARLGDYHVTESMDKRGEAVTLSGSITIGVGNMDHEEGPILILFKIGGVNYAITVGMAKIVAEVLDRALAEVEKRKAEGNDIL